MGVVDYGPNEIFGSQGFLSSCDPETNSLADTTSPSINATYSLLVYIYITIELSLIIMLNKDFLNMEYYGVGQ